MVAHPNVEADTEAFALTHGALIYCLEAVDNNCPLHQYVLATAAPFEGESLSPTHLSGKTNSIYRSRRPSTKTRRLRQFRTTMGAIEKTDVRMKT
ncbi:hypothetical protein [Halocatena marina]|uniref:Non-reducing end beta-L-arabinofuranosidase-like GH127 C-terminal domain-containing protein n=1 Tax=Halocatena marina TaxID=2934937 RepID=A0ABD5YT59_9EURY|nr:hypothetical protein [Halocatena marina]